MTVYAELGKTLKLQRKDEEPLLDFSKRAVKKINNLKDEEWKGLTEPLQVWSNKVQEAVEAAAAAETPTEPELPELDGWPAEETEEASLEEEADDEEDEAEDEAEATDEAFTEAAADETADEETVDESSEEAQEEASEDEAPAARKPKKADKVPKKDTKAAPKPEKAKAKPKDDKPNGKEKVVKTPAAKAASKKSAQESSRNRIGAEQVIKLLKKENPHRTGTKNHKVFTKYKDGMTVAQALKAGIPQRNVYYEEKIGNIKLVKAVAAAKKAA